MGEIVHHIDAKSGSEAAAGERQPLRGAAHDAAARVGMAILDRIVRDFEAPDIEARHDLHQVTHQKALGAADVEHAVSTLEPEMRGHVARDRKPAPVIAVAAIALLAGAVEILPAEPACDDPVLGLAGLARDEVALRARILREQIDLSHGPRSSSRQAWRQCRPRVAESVRAETRATARRYRIADGLSGSAAATARSRPAGRLAPRSVVQRPGSSPICPLRRW